VVREEKEEEEFEEIEEVAPCISASFKARRASKSTRDMASKYPWA
jgi:hypothetical protein